MRNLLTYRRYHPTLANVDRWFDSVFRNWALPHARGTGGHALTGPRVDVQEKGDA